MPMIFNRFLKSRQLQVESRFLLWLLCFHHHNDDKIAAPNLLSCVRAPGDWPARCTGEGGCRGRGPAERPPRSRTQPHTRFPAAAPGPCSAPGPGRSAGWGQSWPDHFAPCASETQHGWGAAAERLLTPAGGVAELRLRLTSTATPCVTTQLRMLAAYLLFASCLIYVVTLKTS